MGWRTAIFCGVLFGALAGPLYSQQASKVERLTIPEIQKRIAAFKTKTELPAAVKDPVISFLERAVERLEIEQEQISKAEGFERRLPLVADQLQKVTKELRTLPAEVDSSVANEIEGVDELEHTVELLSKQIDDPQTGLRKKISELESESELRRVRPEQLMNDLVEVEDRLREIEEELEEVPASGEARDLMQAHQVFLIARRQRAESERRALQAEAGWYESGTAADLLQAQQELETKTLALKTAELDLLQKELVKRRGDEADQRVYHVQTILNRVSPDLKPIAEQNLVLANEHRDVTHKLHDNNGRYDTTSNTIGELNKEFANTRKMIEKVDATDAIGQLLRQQRAKLVDVRAIRSNISHRNDVVRDIRLRQFQLGLDIDALIDLDAAAARQAEAIDPAKQNKSVAAGLKKLLTDQRELLKGLENEYRKYFTKLIQLDVADKDLLKLTTAYSNYIDERILWIRSGQTFNVMQLKNLPASVRWLSDPKSWNSVLDAIKLDVSRRTFTWLSVAIGFLMWVFLNPILRSMLRSRGQIAAQLSCRDLWPTLQSVAMTVFLAAGWPSVIWFVGYRLDHGTTTSPFIHSVASSLLRIAMFVMPLEVIRVVCFRGGVGELHFDWPLELVNRWRRNLNWYLPMSVALIGLIGLVEGTADEHRLDAVGRTTFLAFTLFSGIFSLIVIRRSGIRATTADGYIAPDSDVWSERFWRYAPRLALCICFGLFALGFSGYLYTALQLTWRLQRTVWLGVGLVLLRAVIRRWIALERRRMAILQDEELQSIAASARTPGVSGHNTFLFPRWHWPDFRLNLTQIVSQMRSLLDTSLITLAVIGLWVVWADVTPALNILDRFTLWETTVETNVSVEDGEHGILSQMIKRPKRVTAANLGMACLIVGIAMIAGRNVPGLVEVILLEHLSVDAGARFAATCLVRYAIFSAGVCFAFAQISIGWSNVQWLVAAGSVGLGFGLQEIFCNFVSGIILLFERPMRVGDVVTIGDTTGTISRIRFRATTILDGDRKELVVPNKEFITGKLLNWTLSDRVNRVTVKVMVSGQSDPQKVRRVLLDVAAKHPLLLKEPAPTATLEDLNGGLTFILRGFLPTLDGRSTAIHELYSIIHDRFREEGIDMPCPSSEVFVRMDRAEIAAAPAPHQAPAGVSIKPAQGDFEGAFRRA